MNCLINHNCPTDIIDEFEDKGYVAYLDKFMKGTLTSEEIKEISESVITSNECGATIRIEITKNVILPYALTNENTFNRLGWTDENAFDAYSERMTCDEDSYGFALYRFGKYFILISGFTA